MNEYLPTPGETSGEGKEPPHSIESERGVIGCVLLEPSTITMARSKLAAGPEAFYDLRHQTLWRTLISFDEEQRPIDLITLQQRLRDQGEFEACGGILYLNQILDSVPSVHNLETYLDDVRDKASLRVLIRECTQVVRAAHNCEGGDATAMIADFQTRVSDLTQEHTASSYEHCAKSMSELIGVLEERKRAKNAISGVPTPFWYLNNMTAGLQLGEYSLVAARPSTGKTALACELALHAAASGFPSLFFSIEMGKMDIDMRFLANRARVNGLKLRNGFWRQEREDDISRAFSEIVGLPLYLDFAKSVSAMDIMLGARRAVREHGVKIVFADYAQILAPHTRRMGRTEELTDSSRLLARMSKELGIHVCIAAQLNRGAEQDRAGRRPYLSDIKDCGSFEQDADLVMLLWEPKIDEADTNEMKWLKHHIPDDPKDDSKWITYGPEEGWRDEFRRINLTVGKQRNGPTGDCELVFQKASARFVDAHSPERTKAAMGQII